jgi:hypothetical protein
MRRVIVIGGCAAALAGVTAAPAAACSVISPLPTPTEEFDFAHYALYGRVVSVRAQDELSDRYVAKVRIARVYKGRMGSAVRVRYTTQEGACGLTLKVGQRIGLLLRRPGRPFSISMFNPISRAILDDITNGRWHRPHRR